ncbi:MAG: hypothetical protein A2Y37_03100 [Spirochaetes bacterium GWB1_60_80]|nr:MAG: hypothetical protein A2Y37_03100 [Spirochaetes bacterium GWB1_60_80]OHD41988.1 MAG: hypothetical protein A2Y35_14590 [Spirochaetes bacterium GWE1_60_18]
MFQCITKFSLDSLQTTCFFRPAIFASKVKDEAARYSEIVFFDLETTGLSTRAGTVAFLAALGTIEAGEIVVHQYFLEDYPYESAFIEAVCSQLDKAKYIVTYNGGSFDLPLLRTRCILNRLPFSLVSKHLDIVHTARSLWRDTLQSRTLQTIEKEILGIQRGEDIPGRQIPERWFLFLRDHKFEHLRTVFSHNAVDIVSLARLLIYCNEGFWGHAEIKSAERYGFARLLARVDPVRALETLYGVDLTGRPAAQRFILKLLRGLLERPVYRAIRKQWLADWSNPHAFGDNQGSRVSPS